MTSPPDTVGISCLVADDHPAVVDSVSRYLAAAGMTVCGTASNGDDALHKIERCEPQVAILDVRMPGTSGAELVARVRQVSPRTAAIVYTGFADRGTMTDVLDSGALGFVLKDAPLGDLVRAIQMASTGSLYVDPAVAGVLVSAGPVTLTERERQVLRLVADGHSNNEIGAQLFISPETVRAHLAKASQKLGARTRTQAVVTALRLSLIG